MEQPLTHTKTKSHLLKSVAYALSFVALTAFSLTYLMVYGAPLYVDDAHWPMQNSRIIYDGYQMLNLYPQCVSHLAWPVPQLLIPGRIFSSLLHPDSLLGIRLMGMAKYLVCIGLLACIAYYLFDKKISFFLLVAFCASLSSLGFLPAILTLNRPETAIFIGLSLLVLIWIFSNRNRPTTKQNIMIICLYAAISSWLLSLHPKTQVLIPAVLLIGGTLKLNRKLRTITLFIGIALGISSIMLWRFHQQCPEFPLVEKRLAEHSILPHEFIKNPAHAVEKIFFNISKIPQRYAGALSFPDQYLGHRPGSPYITPVYPSQQLVASALNFLALGIILLLSILSIPYSAKNNSYRTIAWWIPLSILLLAVFTLITRHSPGAGREAGLIVLLFYLFLFWQLAYCKWHIRFPRYAYLIITVGLLAGITSNATFYLKWRNFFEYTQNPNNFVYGTYQPDNLFQTIFDEPERRDIIEALAANCGIQDSQDSKHVVVDDWTYMAFRHTFQPLYGRTLFLHQRYGKINDLWFLQTIESSGVITKCYTLPPALRRISTESSGFCCISKENLWSYKK